MDWQCGFASCEAAAADHGTIKESERDLTHADASEDLPDALEEELAGLEETAELKHEVSADAGVAKLQDALKNRNAQKKEAHAVGATPKVLCKKPAAKVAVLKRPSAKQVASADSQSAAKRTSKEKMRVKAKTKKSVRELKMTRECIYSRAYHQALHFREKKSV
eukprot:s2002_g10.t1